MLNGPILALDADLDVYAVVTYQLLGTHSGLFDIDNSTGEAGTARRGCLGACPPQASLLVLHPGARGHPILHSPYAAAYGCTRSSPQQTPPTQHYNSPSLHPRPAPYHQNLVPGRGGTTVGSPEGPPHPSLLGGFPRAQSQE